MLCGEGDIHSAGRLDDLTVDTVADYLGDVITVVRRVRMQSVALLKETQ